MPSSHKGVHSAETKHKGGKSYGIYQTIHMKLQDRTKTYRNKGVQKVQKIIIYIRQSQSLAVYNNDKPEGHSNPIRSHVQGHQAY